MNCYDGDDDEARMKCLCSGGMLAWICSEIDTRSNTLEI